MIIVAAAGILGPVFVMPAVVLVVVTSFTQLLFIPLRLERARPGFLADIRTSLQWPLGATLVASPLLLPLWEPQSAGWLGLCGGGYLTLIFGVLFRRFNKIRGPLVS